MDTPAVDQSSLARRSSAWRLEVDSRWHRSGITCLYAEGATQPRVMSMSIHPYISGVPHRFKYFSRAYEYLLKHDEVWFTTAEDIYDWYMANPPK